MAWWTVCSWRHRANGVNTSSPSDGAEPRVRAADCEATSRARSRGTRCRCAPGTRRPAPRAAGPAGTTPEREVHQRPQREERSERRREAEEAAAQVGRAVPADLAPARLFLGAVWPSRSSARGRSRMPSVVVTMISVLSQVSAASAGRHARPGVWSRTRTSTITRIYGSAGALMESRSRRPRGTAHPNGEGPAPAATGRRPAGPAGPSAHRGGAGLRRRRDRAPGPSPGCAHARAQLGHGRRSSTRHRRAPRPVAPAARRHRARRGPRRHRLEPADGARAAVDGGGPLPRVAAAADEQRPSGPEEIEGGAPTGRRR